MCAKPVQPGLWDAVEGLPSVGPNLPADVIRAPDEPDWSDDSPDVGEGYDEADDDAIQAFAAAPLVLPVTPSMAAALCAADVVLEWQDATNTDMHQPLDGGRAQFDADSALRDTGPAGSFALFGRNLFGDEIQPTAGGKLAERFTLPPFTVLDARQGAWQDRKRAWLSLGIQSEIGRTEDVLFKSQAGLDRIQRQRRVAPGGGPMPANYANRERGDGTGKPLDEEEFGRSGTSIFDPVLCELMYRWFCPPSGCVLDPFAGGSVRGIVASKLGYSYVGIDLRPEQVLANRDQADHICAGDALPPRWLEGDSCEVAALAAGVKADFIFSCPPYSDLEVYSDDPRDLSRMEYPAFCAAYGRIITAAMALLRPNRFACFVVGDIRDPKGFYRGFPEMTVAAFEAAGGRKYNEAILVTSVGSLPIRTGKIFQVGRKLGKTHQNIFIFAKGNPRLAAAACGGQMELPA